MEKIKTYKTDFALGDTVWFNCSHQGPLPVNSVRAISEATALKTDPSRLSTYLFSKVPLDLKKALSEILHSSPDNIVLGNSATYFVHLLAEGLPWKKNDEIILAKGDFPTNILSWLPLRKKGVQIKKIEFNEDKIDLEYLKKQVTEKTRLICLSWVNSFNGFRMDARAFGEFCLSNNIISCLNGSQAVGYKETNVKQDKIDVLFGCGFKWLLGPYGTGFGYFSDKILNSLNYNKAYWLDFVGSGLEDMRRIGDIEEPTVTNYDIFGTANFLNFMTWTESVKYLLSIGIKNIEKHNFSMIDIIDANLSKDKYQILSPTNHQNKSSILVIKPLKDEINALNNRLLKNNIWIGIRQGNIRISPHIYNDLQDIEILLRALNERQIQKNV